MFIPIGDDQIKGGVFPYFSYGLIVLNILIYLFQTSLTQSQLGAFVLHYGAIPDNIMHGKQYYALLSNMFLHGSWMHLLGNMAFLWVFADNIEASIGHFRFILFYIMGGVAASIAHIYFNTASIIPTIGASGAIAAVMGAYIIMFPKSKIKTFVMVFVINISAFIFLGIWIIQQTYLGTVSLRQGDINVGGVAFWAHIGGFAFGFAFGILFKDLFLGENATVYLEGQHRPPLS